VKKIAVASPWGPAVLVGAALVLAMDLVPPLKPSTVSAHYSCDVFSYTPHQTGGVGSRITGRGKYACEGTHDRTYVNVRLLRHCGPGCWGYAAGGAKNTRDRKVAQLRLYAKCRPGTYRISTVGEAFSQDGTLAHGRDGPVLSTYTFTVPRC
jgi:hypothetical protein